jgi:hypothetical protein
MTWICFRTTLAALLAIAIAPGCAGEDGALQQSTITEGCAPSDVACQTAGLDAPLAEGATLPVDVSVDLVGSGGPQISLASANPDVFTIEEQRLVGARAGVAALLLTTPDGLIVDFTHVWVAQPSAVRLHRITEDGAEVNPLPDRVQLLIGDELIVNARPYSHAQRLLGEPSDVEWAVDPAVIQILEEGTSSRRRLVARAEGTTTLEVTAHGLDTSLELEVLK